LSDTAEIIFKEPGVIIAVDSKPSGMAPYPPMVRPDGSGTNHGFFDLRDQPQLVHLIPEAMDSPGLHSLLTALNGQGSRLFSFGCCERNSSANDDARLPVKMNCYVSIAFRDLGDNRSQKEPDSIGSFRLGQI
jgi:hypothetical protein